LFAFPIRWANCRLQLADARGGLTGRGSPPLPIHAYVGNPETLDSKESVQNVHLALQHRDRVVPHQLFMPRVLRDVFASMEEPSPMLETLQLYCSSIE